jgi:8-oxo-dGTP diphosphatase
MAELWDLTDADGTPTGATHVRGADGWPAGRFHVVAATCVVASDGRVLLTRRAATKDFPGMWEIPAGSALAGETSAEAAVRELHEETGVGVTVDDLRSVGRFQEGTALVDLYVVESPPSPLLRPDPTEVSEAAWVDLAEVERRWHGHELAAPWEARLERFWLPLLRAVDALRP